MNPWLTALLLLSAGGFFAFTMLRRARPAPRAARTDDRLDRPGERFQGAPPLRPRPVAARRPARRSAPASCTSSSSRPSWCCALRTITLFGMGFSQRLPPAAPRPGDRRSAHAYAFVKDVVVLAALCAALAFLWRRLVTKPDRAHPQLGGGAHPRLHRRPDGDRGPLRGGRAARRRARPPARSSRPARSAPPSRRLGLAPRGPRHRRVSFWLHLVIVLVFLNFLPFGKHFHIITGAPRRLRAAAAARAAALRKLDLEIGDARASAPHGERPLLEGGPRHLHLHRVRSLPDPLPHLRHRQAAQPQGGEPRRCATTSQELRRSSLALSRARDAAAREAAAARLPALDRSSRPSDRLGLHHLRLVRDGLPGAHRERAPPRRPAPPPVLVESAFPEEAARVFKEHRDPGQPLGHRLQPPRRVVRRPRRAARLATGALRVALLRRLRRRLRRPAEEGLPRHRRRSCAPAGVDFAILGEEETCTGDAARRLGNEYLFQMQAAANVERHERLRGEEDHRPVPALPQHHQERVPRVRRQLRGGAPHRAHRPAGRRGEARAGRGQGARGQRSPSTTPATSPAGTASPTRRARRSARCRGSAVIEMERNRPAGLLLRRRRRPHVARGEARHPHQPEPGRGGRAPRSARRAAWSPSAAPSASP